MSFLAKTLRGIIVFLIYLLFTFVVFCFFLVVALFKFLIPLPAVRVRTSRMLDHLASGWWVFCSILTNRLFLNIEWDIRGAEEVRTDKWALILTNHQTWVDILVLVKVFYRKLPSYKFFIKRELLWVPMMGFAFWAMDYPIMRRYSREFLEKNPHLKGNDLEATRKACDKYKKTPVTVMNFSEGTRFTREKQRKQNSPFNHLLKPRAGGTALVMYAMGDFLSHILDITIAYPGGAPGLWRFFSQKNRKIIVDVKTRDMRPDLSGNYFADPEFKKHFQAWLNRLWVEKDGLMDELLK